MSLITLRDYQQEALEEIIGQYKLGVNSQLIVLPTGSGKTILMAAIGKHFNKRLLLIAHREELIQQAYDKFKIYWPEADIGICKAEREEVNNQIVIGSIQSCCKAKKLELLKEKGFDILMIDEAHHAAADSYQKVIDELGFRKDENKLLIGVTATPNRSDKQQLGNTFEKITYSRSISTMIKAGYLSPASGRKILTNFSLKNIRTHNGDFSIEDLAEAVNTPERNGFVAQKYKTYASKRKGVVFCADVQHCKDLATAFENAGISAKAIWGNMPQEERKNLIDDLRIGKIQVATSCGVLTEGFDEPSITCIAMARPTKSRSLYIQCVGRGLRTYPGKQNCLVLDFSDKYHNLDSVISLSQAIPNVEYIQKEGLERIPNEIERQSKVEVLEECDKEFDVLGCARFIWIAIGDNEWSLIDDEKREIVMKPFLGGYTACLYLPDKTSQPIVKTPLPLEYCSGCCEDYARKHLKIAFADMNATWMNSASQPTQGQKEYLLKQNAFREGMNKADAALMIRKIIALKNKQRRLMSSEPITQRQRFALKCYGINPKNMSKLEAMNAISNYKMNKVKYG